MRDANAWPDLVADIEQANKRRLVSEDDYYRSDRDRDMAWNNCKHRSDVVDEEPIPGVAVKVCLDCGAEQENPYA